MIWFSLFQQICTDVFTEKDEDEILMYMAKAKGSNQLILTIVPEEIPWNSNIPGTNFRIFFVNITYLIPI